jgi:hypothetical protein
VTGDEVREIAEMIAAWHGRQVIDADLDLAAWLVPKIRGESPPTHYSDPTYGWKPDGRA